MGALALPVSRKLELALARMTGFSGIPGGATCDGKMRFQNGIASTRISANAATISHLRHLRRVAASRSCWRRRVKAAAAFGCQPDGDSNFARRSSTQELSLCSIVFDVLLAE